MTWEVGSRVNLRLRVYTARDVLTSPTSVSLSVRTPGGVETDYAVTAESAGVYVKAITVSEAGLWRYTWTTAGTLVGVKSRVFHVQAPEVP